MRLLAASLLLSVIAAAPVTRIRHEGTFASGAVFERFTLKQIGAETFDLELASGKTACLYRVGWIQMRPHALARTVDFQAKRKGECAVSAAESLDGAIVLDRKGAGGVIRLIEGTVATELAVDHAREVAP